MRGGKRTAGQGKKVGRKSIPDNMKRNHIPRGKYRVAQWIQDVIDNQELPGGRIIEKAVIKYLNLMPPDGWKS